MSSTRTFSATIERDEAGVWCGVVQLGRNKSATSDAPTIARCRERLRQAVAVSLECDESEVALEVDVRLPDEAQTAVAQAHAAKVDAQVASAAVELANVNAAAVLGRLGYSRRDTGDLLGLTRQRASQLGSVAYLLNEDQERVVLKILKSQGVGVVRAAFVRVAKAYPWGLGSVASNLPGNEPVFVVDVGSKAVAISEEQYDRIRAALKRAKIPLAPSAAHRAGNPESSPH